MLPSARPGGNFGLAGHTRGGGMLASRELSWYIDYGTRILPIFMVGFFYARKGKEMVVPAFYSGYVADTGPVLEALRTQYEYTDREPDRATGWLYADRQIGQLPFTPWAGPLSEHGPRLLDLFENLTGVRFNVACFQAYLDGSGVSWHYDRDWDAQVVLSLGVTRTFGLRRTGSGNEEFTSLREGDVLFMPSGFQEEWEHCVPVEKVPGERCSLVFRSV